MVGSLLRESFLERREGSVDEDDVLDQSRLGVSVDVRVYPDGQVSVLDIIFP